MRWHRALFIRAVIYSLAIAWLAGDLLLWKGPVSRLVSRAGAGPSGRADVIARVNGLPLRRWQLETAVWRKAWAEGRDPREEGRLPEFRRAALADLIDDHIVGRRAAWNPPDVTPAEAERQWRLWRRSWPGAGERERALREAGLEEEDWREVLDTSLATRRWIEARIEGDLAVEAGEVRARFEERPEEWRVAPRVRLRHVFLAAAGGADRESEARGLHARLAGGDPFADVAGSHSEDARSAPGGGELPWVTERGMPPALGAALFPPGGGPEPGAGLLEPIRSKLGWHVVEVLERLPAMELPFEEVAPLIETELRSEKRLAGVERLRRALRAESDVVIYWDRIDF